MNDVESKQSRSQEENRSQETKRNIGFEFRTLAFSCDSVPVPDRSAVHWADEISEQSKSDHEQYEKDEIHRPMDKTACEREEEEQREENANCGNHFSVNEAFLGPCRFMFIGMKILSCEAGDDSCECQLADAETEGEEIFC